MGVQPDTSQYTCRRCSAIHLQAPLKDLQWRRKRAEYWQPLEPQLQCQLHRFSSALLHRQLQAEKVKRGDDESKYLAGYIVETPWMSGVERCKPAPRTASALCTRAAHLVRARPTGAHMTRLSALHGKIVPRTNLASIMCSCLSMLCWWPSTHYLEEMSPQYVCATLRVAIANRLCQVFKCRIAPQNYATDYHCRTQSAFTLHTITTTQNVLLPLLHRKMVSTQEVSKHRSSRRNSESPALWRVLRAALQQRPVNTSAVAHPYHGCYTQNTSAAALNTSKCVFSQTESQTADKSPEMPLSIRSPPHAASSASGGCGADGAVS